MISQELNRSKVFYFSQEDLAKAGFSSEELDARQALSLIRNVCPLTDDDARELQVFSAPDGVLIFFKVLSISSASGCFLTHIPS